MVMREQEANVRSSPQESCHRLGRSRSQLKSLPDLNSKGMISSAQSAKRPPLQCAPVTGPPRPAPLHDPCTHSQHTQPRLERLTHRKCQMSRIGMPYTRLTASRQNPWAMMLGDAASAAVSRSLLPLGPRRAPPAPPVAMATLPGDIRPDLYGE
ncbi:unnamed protein product, partial [Iphiclides podalirius]